MHFLSPDSNVVLRHAATQSHLMTNDVLAAVDHTLRIMAHPRHSTRVPCHTPQITSRR
jgi:hypothetical protein